MHKILFKGIRVDNGEWVEGYYVTIGEKYHYILTGKLDITQGYPEFEHFSIVPETAGQYTGSTDKNGKLIFDGDIVKYKGERYVIKYLEKYTRFAPVKPGTVFAVFDYTQSEIIGNIHDNPDC